MTANSVEDAVAKLIRRTEELRAETKALRNALGNLVEVPKYFEPPDSATKEPTSALHRLLVDFLRWDSPKRWEVIKAMDDDFFAAMQDIRKARMDIEEIIGTPDLREKFKRNLARRGK